MEQEYKELLQSNKVTLIVGGLCLLLIIMVSRQFLKQIRYEEDSEIVAHIERLGSIFEAIHESSQIVALKGRKAPINFLTVNSFAGSSVGPLQLAYPDRWGGPYFAESPEVQGKEFQIITTKKGSFIVPGDGVRLANGKVIGETIRFTDASDIAAMMKDQAFLLSKDKPLAAALSITPQKGPLVQTRVVDFDEADDISTY